ncbi:MAG: hypothetical protein GXP45_08135 [bacterium]|nr:hypothetical protein [bacterium]
MIKKTQKNNKQGEFALEAYINSIVKYIGAYTALMNGVSAIILSAGVLEGNTSQHQYFRKQLMQRLSFLNIELDTQANQSTIKSFKKISQRSNKTQVYVIHTQEELLIARQCFQQK